MLGVLVLTASTIIVKIIGLAYKIPLMSVMGADGMGYFNSAYEIYALLCGISTSGLPIAVSMLISSASEQGDLARERGIFRTASALLLTKGILSAGLLALFARSVSRFIGNADAYLAILAISPALLFACISAAIRSYFQGHRRMAPTAISQLIEAVCKLIFGVAFACLALAMGLGLPTVAAFAVMGVSLGSLLAALFLVIKRAGETQRRQVSATGKCRSCFWALLRISLPITVGSALMGSTRIIDMAFIMRRLQDIGVSPAETNRIYGAYTTLALPIYGLVPAFIPPITESLIPRLSAAAGTHRTDEERRAVASSMRLTLLLGVPSSLGIILYSSQIITLLFGEQTEAIRISAPLLSALGVSVLLTCMTTTITAVLQSYKKVLAPILALAVGVAVKAVSAYFLIGNPDIRELGAPISTLLFNVTVLAVDLVFAYRTIPRGTGVLAALPRCVVSSGIAVVLSYAVFLILDSRMDSARIPFLGALAVAVVVYFLLAYAFSIVSKDDISVISKR
jgi:stage V sporulation protein B